VNVVIGPATAQDAGEILTVQRAAYLSEAQLYGDCFLDPLTEPLSGIVAAIEAGTVLVGRCGTRLVGAVRARIDSGTCHIGRLVVAPDRQGHGIGSRLLATIEDSAREQVDEFALFTGDKSEQNLGLYYRFGYAEVGREQVTPSVTLVHLRKPAARFGKFGYE
jgi:GNAT superfamily N-acetyltransferase